ncbi:pilus assembly FimT family protein [Hydrogenimonas sp.]
MKKAFTMLELIMVILVVAILSVIMIPRFSDDKLREAADQIISHIRYTQHLAMIDDKFSPTDANWPRSRYQIAFYHDGSGDGHLVYTVFSDEDMDSNTNPEVGEIATDPSTGNLLIGDSNYGKHSELLDLTAKFGIDSIQFCGSATALTTSNTGNSQHIYFDNLARPYYMSSTWTMNGLFGDLLTATCDIVFQSNDGNFTISIEPETGYVHLTSINY